MHFLPVIFAAFIAAYSFCGVMSFFATVDLCLGRVQVADVNSIKDGSFVAEGLQSFNQS